MPRAPRFGAHAAKARAFYNQREASRDMRNLMYSARTIAQALMLLAAAPIVSAGTYQDLYENAQAIGGRMLAPVERCRGARGTVSLWGQAGVVRTTHEGTRVWSRRLDVPAESAGIVELVNGSGFVVAGTTITPSGAYRDVFLAKLTCDGAVSWFKTYPGPSDATLHAVDLIQAESGASASASRVGDLIVVANLSKDTGTTHVRDGFVMRATPDGMMRWSKAYHSPNGSDIQLRAAIEVRPLGANRTGEIVAVGSLAPFDRAGSQGYLVRVSGDDGSITRSTSSTAPSQGASVYGTEGRYSAFYAAAAVPDATSAVIVAGEADTPGLYIARAQGAPGKIVAQRTLLRNDSSGIAWVGRMIFAPATDGTTELLMAGSLPTPTAGGATTLTRLDPATLQPRGLGRVYADFALFSIGLDVIRHATGFALVAASDGRLQLIGTDAEGATGCDSVREVASEAASVPSTEIAVTPYAAPSVPRTRKVRTVSDTIRKTELCR